LWHGGRPHMGPGVRRDDKTDSLLAMTLMVTVTLP
jgi:hypothetical protein